MIPWSTDARESIKDLSLVTDDAIHETVDIRRFLRQDRFNMIVASKGFGKSLLLLAKRRSLPPSYQFVPYGRLLDVPALYIDVLSRDAKSILYDTNLCAKLWGIILAAVAVHAIRKENDEVPRDVSDVLRRLLTDDACRTVAGALNFILHLSRREFARLCDDYGTVIIPLAQQITHPVAIFIDNVDECFREEKDLWYSVQAALIEATYRTLRLNPIIKLYVSIRREAYLKHLPETEMGLQYEGVCLYLTYSKSELRDIFDRNIRADSSDILVDPSVLRANAVAAFLGTARFPHGYVMEDEDSFDYIYRHTLRRPRDFMEIGAAIARTPIADRRPNTSEGLNGVKAAINDAGSRICDSYLQEVMPHLDITRADFDRMCALIDGNILTSEQLKKLCMMFNGGKVECLSRDCASCKDGKHVFCQLYKAGLIGIVGRDPATGAFAQRFPAIGERLFCNTPILPDSDFYLIHPVLDDKIRNMSSRYRRHIDSTNIVGYDRTWRHSRVPLSEPNGKPVVFISSTMDLKQYRDIAEEVIDEERFEVRRSEYENSPDSLQRIKELSVTCHLFIAVLGPRYGDAVDGKSVCEHEFEAAHADNPSKILVYALDVPAERWEVGQLAFLERIQSLAELRYARGERITVRNYKQRLHKDVLERTASLMRHTESEGSGDGGTRA